MVGLGWVTEGSREEPHPTPAIPVSAYSVIIPEKLDSFINKFAEYTHEKWAFDKVNAGSSTPPARLPQAPYLL